MQGTRYISSLLVGVFFLSTDVEFRMYISIKYRHTLVQEDFEVDPFLYPQVARQPPSLAILIFPVQFYPISIYYVSLLRCFTNISK